MTSLETRAAARYPWGWTSESAAAILPGL